MTNSTPNPIEPFIPSIIIAFDISSFNAEENKDIDRSTMRRNMQEKISGILEEASLNMLGANDTGDGMVLIFRQEDCEKIYGTFLPKVEEAFTDTDDNVRLRCAVNDGLVILEHEMPITNEGFSSRQVNETFRLLDSDLFRQTRNNINVANNPLIVYSKSFYEEFIISRGLDQENNFTQVDVETKDNFVQAYIGNIDRAEVLSSNNRIKLNLQSANRFYENVVEMNRGIFFNIQIDLKQWFSPELQIHLAIQDSIKNSIQLEEYMFDCVRSVEHPVHNRIYNKCHSHIPKKVFSRVLFLKETKHELNQAIAIYDDKTRNLVSFIQIQNLMSCPLAIVTIDQLLRIFKDNIDIIAPWGNLIEKALGFPTDIVDRLNNINNDLQFDEYTKELQSTKFFSKQIIQNGQIIPNIDFALFGDDFSNNRTWNKVWAATKTVNRELVYYPIDESVNLENYFNEININSIDDKIDCSTAERRQVLTEFGKLIAQSVFTDLNIRNEDTEIAYQGGNFDPIFRLLNNPDTNLEPEYNYNSVDKFSGKKLIENFQS